MPDLDQYDGLLEGIREYLSHHRPFATPRYFIQDRTSEVQRRGNLFGGYPYTSVEYPWPLTDGVGYPMQPVVQIDLKDASKILGLDLGDGLLQVWGRVDHDLEQAHFQIKNKYNSQILLRLISYEKLQASVLSDFPEISLWEDKEVSNKKGDLQLVFPDTPDEMRVGSRIEWIDAGDMWQHPIKLECNEEIDDYYFVERVFDDLQEVIITPKNAPDVYLGGHGGQSGGWDDPSIYDEESPILFRAHLGSGMNLAIMVKIESDDAPVFKWVIRYHY